MDSQILTQLEQLWEFMKLIMYIGSGFMGCCVGGFFYLLKTRDSFEKKLDDKLQMAVVSLSKIEIALIGSFDKKGALTIIHEHTEAINNVKEKLNMQ